MSDYKGSVGLIDGNRINLIGKIDPNLIKIDQIANALSKKCRFNGQCTDFYSVAEHCVHVSRLTVKLHKSMPELKQYDPALCGLAALLHDASEAYMSDFVTPLKVLFPEYMALEDKLQKVIFKKYNVPTEILDWVHNNTDRYASYIEIRQLGTYDWADELRISNLYYFNVLAWDHNKARR